MAQAAWLLEPIWKAMKAEVLKSRVIQTDDTTVPVLDRRLDRARTARLWVYLGDRDHPYIVYDYTADRSRDGPERFLGDYQRLPPGRRLQRLRPDLLPGRGRGRVLGPRAPQVLRRPHERPRAGPRGVGADPRRSTRSRSQARDLDEAGRLALRRERSAPLLERLGTWLDEQARVVLPEEPDRRGDRLRPVELGGVEPIHSRPGTWRSTTTPASGP